MFAASVRLVGGLVVAILLFGIGPAAAREARGTISGRVLDTSKAVVLGASLSVTNVAMGTTTAVVTNEAGLFQVPYLIPGTYRVVAELSGFQKHVREGLEPRVGHAGRRADGRHRHSKFVGLREDKKASDVMRE